MNNHEIIEFYECGNSLAATSRKAKLSIYKIKKILQKNGIETRTRHQQAILENMRRAKPVNHFFFKTLNLVNSYYLGFLAADGYVSEKNNLIKIGLSSVDREFLLNFRKMISAEQEVIDHITNKGFAISELRFSSLEIKRTLISHSIVPNKTKIGVSMKTIPDEFKLAFIKGYFDGDGCFTFNPKTKQCQLKITSKTKGILDEIQSFLGKGKIYSYNNIFSFECSTRATIEIMNSFYLLDTPELERKKEKFEKAISIRIQNSPRVKDSANADEKVR
jgi:hypothetical protein